MKLRSILSVVFFLSCLVTLQAQDVKVAVADVNYIMANIAQAQVPEFMNAQENIQLYGEKLQEELGTKYQALEQLAATYGQNPTQEQIQELQQKELEFQQEQQNAQNKLAQKENDELQPIYKLIEDAMLGIINEQGFTFVLRKEALLYEMPGTDISNEILTRMGLTPISDSE